MIYLLIVMIHGRVIVMRTEQPTKWFEPFQKLRARFAHPTNDLSPCNLFIIVGWDSVFCWGSTDDLLWLQIFGWIVWQFRDFQLFSSTLYLLSPRLCFFKVLTHDLFANRDDSWTSYKVIMRTEQPII